MASRPISPVEPTKKHILPNAHPYAVKTTSSGLLSGSSSSPHYANHMRHHYIPAPPSRVTTEKVRHRHASSLSSVEGEAHNMAAIPAPLPTPPSALVAATDDPSESPEDLSEPGLTHRVRRASTMPSSIIEPIAEHDSDDPEPKQSHDQCSKSTLYPGLPPNPKQWNTDELATYLQASLSLGNDSADSSRDDTTVVDILDYVRTRSLTGRELLRLTDGDLVGTPLSDAQRAQLLERSRTLRADVLRGRIYVDSYHSQDISDNSKDIYSFSARAASVRGASASADELYLLVDNNVGESADAFPTSPVMTLHHRSNSVSEASAQRYRDLARMRMRRRGRVKGLVETWERARVNGGESSASEEESVSGSDVDPDSESSPGVDHSPERSPDSPSDLHDASPHSVRSPMVHSTDMPPEPSLSTPPPPYTHVFASHAMDEEEELTIEELLASSSNVPLKGVHAWEADFGIGETVKRVPVSLDTDSECPFSSSVEQSTAHDPQDDGKQTGIAHVQSRSKGSSVRGSTGKRDKNPKTQKTQNRVVTAIFTGSTSEGISETINDEVRLAGKDPRAGVGNGDIREASSDLQNGCDNTIRALEESIAITRAQLDAFRVRLEQVEADTARQEAKLGRTEWSDAHYAIDTRQQRLEASVQTTEELLVTETRDGDLLEMWETLSLSDMTRAIVAKAMQWLFPYEHSSVHAHDDDDHPLVRVGGARPGENDKYPPPAKRGGRFALARVSCGILLVSFAICTAVLRRMGFGRWVRRP